MLNSTRCVCSIAHAHPQKEFIMYVYPNLYEYMNEKKERKKERKGTRHFRIRTFFCGWARNSATLSVCVCVCVAEELWIYEIHSSCLPYILFCRLWRNGATLRTRHTDFALAFCCNTTNETFVTFVMGAVPLGTPRVRSVDLSARPASLFRMICVLSILCACACVSVCVCVHVCVRACVCVCAICVLSNDLCIIEWFVYYLFWVGD